MKPFNRKDFDLLLNQLQGLKIQPIDDDPKAFGVVNIRHDVDDDLAASFDFAKLEQYLGIKSTYFILDTAPYWSIASEMDVLWNIALTGQLIGWHNNAISKHIREAKPLNRCICEALSELDQYAPVNGTASHGDPLCYEKGYLNYYIFNESKPHPKFPNRDQWVQFSLSDFGLEYEAYHTGHTHYISDSGGNWQQNNDEVIASFRKGLALGQQVKLQVLLHPQWWQL